jgi:hypothetical protein
MHSAPVPNLLEGRGLPLAQTRLHLRFLHPCALPPHKYLMRALVEPRKESKKGTKAPKCLAHSRGVELARPRH